MGAGYLIDTNVVSDFFKAALPQPAKSFIQSLFDAGANLSIISQIELLSWIANPVTEALIKSFLNESSILQIAPSVIAACADIRRQKTLKLHDALIAATAISYSLTIVTRNVSDFTKVAGLNVLNPYDLI